MIIVGNLEKLYKFPSWQPFIEHVYKSGLARKGQLRDEPDEDGVLIQRIVQLPRFHDDSSEESSENDEEESSTD